MYFDFKTSYNDDIRLIRRPLSGLFYAIAFGTALFSPLVISEFYITESSAIFVLGIIIIGYMISAGMAGLVGLGHAAFVGVGAYTHAILLGAGVPFLISIFSAIAVCALLGVMLAVISLRLSGLYLAISTLIFALAVEHILGSWETLTGGYEGILVPDPIIFGTSFASSINYYYLTLSALVSVIILAANLMRSLSGRALIGLRDSEQAAASLGINVLKTKSVAFALSGAVTGFGGALMSHQIFFITPEAFNMMLSLQIVLAAVIGGLGSITGALIGAVVIGWMPELISQIKALLPVSIRYQPGPDLVIYGAVLIGFVLFEPLGLYGRWKKIENWLLTFPLDRKATFAKTRTYMKSERV
ncbi:leucine/isoleucine/valine transporter permease subunit [Pseudovibrio axinellae]|uniref:Leucine/isoleucine/valine transporter permease subunit n=1 Tax=Pseudovibrio axinellae TaxID=989403 RepID=A0A165ZGA5_9HYPH|nr:branched-chain amino acid ABC transporter permease [Pseudovibrio axinellae]KZL19867.1 leucine/isoleucine/valine transporter permease subunit [Pseudovibrio axinellae]SER38723.1 amino acid/amide ABC transporter membrane protein 2, HAAT family [Pseudovibrio axinellae]